MCPFEPHKNEEESKSEKVADSEIRVVKLDTNRSTHASEYEFQELSKQARQGNRTRFYDNRKEVLQAHHESLELRRKNRFSLYEEVRGSLQVDEKERAEIEERVRGEVEKIAAEERKRAKEIGYKEGFEQGHLKAFEEFKDQSKSKMESIESCLRSFENAKNRIFKENEKFLVDLVYHIGKQLALHELKEDRSYIVRLAKEIIERVGLSENIRVKVNPTDLERIDELREGIMDEIKGLKNLTIEGSEKVIGGGCIVETAWNEIDASIDHQFNNIYKALVDRQIVKESENTEVGSAQQVDETNDESQDPEDKS